MDKAWITIIVAGLMEVVWATAMGYSNGFTIWYWDIIVVIFLALSIWLLSKAVNSGLPVGTAYAVWTGIGAVGTIAVSVALGNETLTVFKVLFVLLIIIGIVGLQMSSEVKSEEKSE